MSNIIRSVSSAFSVTRDTRIDYHIAEKGSASLLTGVYDQETSSGFYKKPDITSDNSTKIGVIYGEMMITPTLVDAGVESSTNDPASILKTYRFITGDGVNSGPVVGPNGSPLENIYIKDPNGVPQPIVNSDGRPSLSNVILASALGGAITSAPKIWDAIKGAAPSSAQTKTVDPITGKPLLSTTEKAAAAIAAKMELGQLTNVDETGKGDNFVLTYDAAKGKWIAKSFNTGLTDSGALSSSEVCGGSGGAGGSGGSGGSGGAGGDGGGGGTPVEPPLGIPTSDPVSEPCVEAPETAPHNGMILLPTLVNTANNEYTQSIPALGSKGCEFHFFAAGNGKKAVYDPANPTVSYPEGSTHLSCFVDPTSATTDKIVAGAPISYIQSSKFEIKLCLTANICGNETLIYSGTITEAALSATSYTFMTKILWTDTKLASLLANYPGQVFTKANPDLKLYLSRIDECESEYPLYFEGYTRLIENEKNRTIWDQPTFKGPGGSTTGGTTSSGSVKPVPIVKKADDGKFPLFRPAGGGMGVPSCPEPAPIPTDPTAGQPGSPGTGGSPGGTPTDGTCGTVDVAAEKAQPTLELNSPCSRQYGTQTTPPAFDPVTLPSFFTALTGIASTSVNVTYSIETGNGTFQTTGSIPGTVTAFPSDRQMLLVGPVADVKTASEHIQLIPANGSAGDIHYTVVLENAEGTKAGAGCLLVPSQIIIENSVAGTAKICIDASCTTGTGTVSINWRGWDLTLTSSPVPFNTSPAQTTNDLAANIAANVIAKNALDPTDTNWLPAFVIAVTGSTEITISSPVAAGGEFNGISLSTAVTGGFVFGNCVGTFLGGVTKTVTDFLKTNVPNWDKVSNVLLGIGGNVLGAVLTNVIMNGVGQTQISIPTTEDVELAFLYRGRVIKVPTEYDATARTGHPASYDAWGGTWKTQYSNNPAWCLYDFIINKKYGLGRALTLTPTQETALLRDIFAIGYYSDDLIDTKPRFSCNTVITDGTRMEILGQLCSVFFGGYTFVNGGLRIVIDKPTTAVKMLVTQANASNIEKTFTNGRNFVNKVRLSYIEPSNFYTENVVVAEVADAVDDFGERAIETVAFGCTDVDEALRKATQILNSEVMNTINISYQAGFDHYNLIPGDIVELYDNSESTSIRSGRIVSQSGATVILDRTPTTAIGDFFSLVCSDGSIHQTTVAGKSGATLTVTAAPVVSANPYQVWIGASASIGRQLYRVIKIDETSNSKFNVSLQLYSADKY